MGLCDNICSMSKNEKSEIFLLFLPSKGRVLDFWFINDTFLEVHIITFASRILRRKNYDAEINIEPLSVKLGEGSSMDNRHKKRCGCYCCQSL